MQKLKIRKDRMPAMLRKLAKTETDARVARRLLAIANALGGLSRGAAAASAGMDRQTLRDAIGRSAVGAPCKAIGKPSKVVQES